MATNIVYVVLSTVYVVYEDIGAHANSDYHRPPHTIQIYINKNFCHI